MRRKLGAGDVTFNILNYMFLAALMVCTLYPFINLLAISLNESTDTLRGQVYLWPNALTWDNYRVVFQNEMLLGATLRSVARTVLGTALSLIGSVMLAYTLSRKEFFLRKSINLIMVISMYISGGLIPTYILIKNLGLTNSFWVYIIPGLISVFNVIIIRTYFDQLPDGLVEAARIDGANEFQTLFRIVIPVSMPVLATVTLFVSVGHWNSWFDNYMYNTRDNLNLLQYELMKILMQSTQQVTSNATGSLSSESLRQITPQSIRATMTIIVTIPILFVYPFLQRYFIKGIMIGAVKE
ncbi:carbohydrate ABC transporter permease [Paenibacillus dokdonensis]|uniref:carbohydrate ABC transporter permease n=1 Tax=Paenibacillus dokdonensis TaxID=2567944 RepID=UPI0010A8B9B6|nr:carbohydrate ABC transporter permease [Paenibacillus dokdonensis]